MSIKYNDRQKAMIMLGSDLLDRSLVAADKQAWSLALDAAGGNVQAALEVLPP